MEIKDSINKSSESLDFKGKLGLTALLVIVILIVKATFNVFLMVLAATLIAVFFEGFAGLIRRYLKLPPKWSMAASILGTFILLFLLFWLIGAKVQSQVQELRESLPTMVDHAKNKLQQSSIGQKVLDQISGNGTKDLSSSAKRFLNSTFGVLGDIYVILFFGNFFYRQSSDI